MNELISVIIPVYNVENYIVRCVQSVQNQTYKNLEIILVDDGSTDMSGKICDELSKEDYRIITIHQDNRGLGPARNAGLEIINGDYVSFVDSDDWLEPDFYEMLLSAIKINNCDIATCGRVVLNEKKIIKYVYCSTSELVLDQVHTIKHYLLQRDMNMSACDKLYKSSLFNNIRFSGDHLVSEDIIPIYQVIKNCSKTTLTGKPLYNYFYRNGSLSKEPFSAKKLGVYKYSKIVADNVRNQYPALKNEADYFEIDSLITVYRSIRNSGYTGPEEKKIYCDLKNCLDKALANKYLYLRQKIYVILAILRIDLFPNWLYGKYKYWRMQ